MSKSKSRRDRANEVRDLFTTINLRLSRSLRDAFLHLYVDNSKGEGIDEDTATPAPSPVGPPSPASGLPSHCPSAEVRRPIVIKHKSAPCQWSRASFFLKASIGAFVLKQEGHAYKFDLSLDPDTIAAANASPRFITYAREHLERRLEAALGRKPEFIVVLEHFGHEWGTGKVVRREHLHGIIGLREAEFARARRAIWSFGSFCPTTRLWMEPLECPFSGGGYATKEAELAEIIEGASPMYMTRSLSRKARALYEAALERHEELVVTQRPPASTTATEMAA